MSNYPEESFGQKERERKENGIGKGEAGRESEWWESHSLFTFDFIYHQTFQGSILFRSFKRERERNILTSNIIWSGRRQERERVKNWEAIREREKKEEMERRRSRINLIFLTFSPFQESKEWTNCCG